MKDVAAYKWDRELPIEDLKRERVVLENSVEDAKLYGLDETFTRDFFQFQIELAKEIQSYWFRYWKDNNFNYPEYKDLNKVIRPQLISLGDSIVKDIADLHRLSFDAHSLEKLQPVFVDISRHFTQPTKELIK